LLRFFDHITQVNVLIQLLNAVRFVEQELDADRLPLKVKFTYYGQVLTN